MKREKSNITLVIQLSKLVHIGSDVSSCFVAYNLHHRIAIRLPWQHFGFHSAMQWFTESLVASEIRWKIKFWIDTSIYVKALDLSNCWLNMRHRFCQFLLLFFFFFCECFICVHVFSLVAIMFPFVQSIDWKLNSICCVLNDVSLLVRQRRQHVFLRIMWDSKKWAFLFCANQRTVRKQQILLCVSSIGGFLRKINLSLL